MFVHSSPHKLCLYHPPSMTITCTPLPSERMHVLCGPHQTAHGQTQLMVKEEITNRSVTCSSQRPRTGSEEPSHIGWSGSCCAPNEVAAGCRSPSRPLPLGTKDRASSTRHSPAAPRLDGHAEGRGCCLSASGCRLKGCCRAHQAKRVPAVRWAVRCELGRQRLIDPPSTRRGCAACSLDGRPPRRHG